MKPIEPRHPDTPRERNLVERLSAQLDAMAKEREAC